MCCLAGHQPVCVGSGAGSRRSAAAGAPSMFLLMTEGTAAGTQCPCWVCLVLWEECSIVRRTFLLRDLTRYNMGEGNKCLKTRLRFSTAHVTEECTFTPHPDPCFLQRDQSCHLSPSKKAFISSQSSFREPWFRGAWSYTGAPGALAWGELASMTGVLFYLP